VVFSLKDSNVVDTLTPINISCQDQFLAELQELMNRGWATKTLSLDVLMAYRLLLRRFPEFSDVQSYRERTGTDLRDLISGILLSPEFKLVWNTTSEMLPDLTVMTEYCGGLRYWFKLRDLAIGMSIALQTYEPEVTSLLQSLIRPGMVCIDVGANIGFYSILMASVVQASGRVYSVEPFPDSYVLLLKNIAENGVQDTVVPMQIAAHERSGPMDLYFLEDVRNINRGGMFVLNGDEGTVTKGHSRIPIEAKPLHECVPMDRKIDFIKVDVEGSEVCALRGMERIIQRWHPTIIVEVNETCLRSMGGTTAATLVDILKRFGYRLYDASLAAKGVYKEYMLPAQSSSPVFGNLLCRFGS
jgi:FkbM family methyltransferase